MILMKYKLFIILVLTSISIQGQVTVASIFSDNMVLQRNTKIPIWGWAKANEKITIKFHNQAKAIRAAKNGKWIVRLDNENSGGPYILDIKGENHIQIKNVLVGDVWLCSGQSNMEWTVGQSDNAKKEISDATFPTIRHIKIPTEINSVPNTDLKKTTWEVCSPETVAAFTGIGYFYAKELNQKLNIPIGLINTSWGASSIETWISREGFESSEEYQEMIAQMPKINLEDLLKLKLENAKKRIETLQKYSLTNDNISFYKDLNYNDVAWLELQQPTIWEEQSLGNFDGVVWLRKHFTLTEIPKNATLEIPAIDDDDVTYINGFEIGETLGWNIKRNYKIPQEILKKGDNVIAIKVTDNGGSGGIHGDENILKLTIDNKETQLAGTWKFQVESIKNNINRNEFPSLCFNAMINPLIPFAFKGVIWYQGEENVKRASQYNKAFPLLIDDWRKKWNVNFPFYYVQLATFFTKDNSNEGCAWAELREAQNNTLKIPNVAMVVTTDIGSPNDIHPTNKQTVGKRLASIAFNNLYDFKMICSGPTFKTYENKENLTVLTFDAIGSGLTTTDKYGYLKGFEAAGKDHVFYYAKAIIKDDKVILTCDKVPNPIAIRFGWMGDASDCNLFNNEGYPANPFRTDDWNTITKNVKYSIKN